MVLYSFLIVDTGEYAERTLTIYTYNGISHAIIKTMRDYIRCNFAGCASKVPEKKFH